MVPTWIASLTTSTLDTSHFSDRYGFEKTTSLSAVGLRGAIDTDCKWLLIQHRLGRGKDGPAYQRDDYLRPVPDDFLS